jgi:hypothetical protein
MPNFIVVSSQLSLKLFPSFDWPTTVDVPLVKIVGEQLRSVKENIAKIILIIF